MPTTRRRSPSSLWAYAYMIVPPLPRSRLTTVRAILDAHHAAAEGGARVWTGRLVLETRITCILIVSDSSEQNHGTNARLEAELRQLNAQFLITQPLAIPGDPEGIPVPEATNGDRVHAAPPLGT